MNDFERKLLILRKADFPILMNSSDDVVVDFKDESSESKGILDVRTSFDFGLELWYRKNVKVIRVTPQKTNV